MNILKLILLYLFASLATYFLTAFTFYECDLNFMNWKPISRFNVIFMGFTPLFWLYNDRD